MVRDRKCRRGLSHWRGTLCCVRHWWHTIWPAVLLQAKAPGKVTMVPVTHSWSKEPVSVPTLTSRGRKLIAFVPIHLQGKESHLQEARLWCFTEESGNVMSGRGDQEADGEIASVRAPHWSVVNMTWKTPFTPGDILLHWEKILFSSFPELNFLIQAVRLQASWRGQTRLRKSLTSVF